MKNSKKHPWHEPVMIVEVLDALGADKLAHLNKRGIFIDATVGYGGHSQEIVSRGHFVLGLDEDTSALKNANEALKQACPPPQTSLSLGRCFKLINANFRDIDKVARGEKLTKVDGILFDLGVSSPQLTSKERGFSFAGPNATLDMRMNPESQGVKGYDLLNALDENQLASMFSEVVNKGLSRVLAKSVVSKRTKAPLRTVGDFLSIIEKPFDKSRIHHATLPFLALRMAVNSETENLKEALPKAYSLIASGGRLVVISFHSLEDRIVKNYFKEVVLNRGGREIIEGPIVPSKDEVEDNPRARSAKLRAIEKK